MDDNNASIKYPTIDPRQPIVIEAIEHKIESFTGKDVRVYLWVDINGLKIVDASKRTVQWSARLNTIVQWAVRDDYFWCRMIYKRGEQRERGFLTGYSKAVTLKASMETFVNLHLKDKEAAASLMAAFEDPQQGAIVEDSFLSRAEPFESGLFREPALAVRYASRVKQGSGRSSSLTVGQAASPAQGALEDELPENAPPPWVLTDEEAAIMAAAGGDSSPATPKSLAASLADGKELIKLRATKEQLETELEVAKMNTDVYRQEMDRLHDELDALQNGTEGDASESRSSSRELSALKSENMELQQKVAELQKSGGGGGGGGGGEDLEEAEMWQAEKEVLMSMMEEKEVQVEQLEKEVEELKLKSTAAVANGEAAAAATAAVEANSKNKEEVTQIREEKDKMEEQLVTARGSLLQQNNKISELQTTLAKMTHQAQHDKTLGEQSRQQAQKLKAGMQMIVSEIANMKASQAQMRQDAELIQSALPYAASSIFQEVKFFMATMNMAPLEEMAKLYRSEVVERKRLHNEIVDIKGNIRVFCRVRPLMSSESGGDEDGEAIRFPLGDESIAVRCGVAMMDMKQFTFDRTFKPEEDQPAVFSECSSLITSVLDGYNVTIFAYGQTGSGKTHTMSGSASNPGVNLRALGKLFQIAQKRSGDYDTSISASILEIYNEGVYDLLNSSGHDKSSAMEVRHASGEGTQVLGLTISEVTNVAEVDKLVALGNSNRSTYATNMNEHSSRSHSMLSVYVTSTNRQTGEVSKGKLHLVDLAGSERLSRTGADGDRLKEAQAINKSLSSLGDVISALAVRSQHIPYRNSKLTQVLQDSLGGSAKVLMFVNCSPTIQSSSETLCSLNFAARVRGVELGQAQKNTSGNSTPNKSTPSKGAKKTPSR
ncbi:hypothetical protein CYMTET_53018 [Cymbomonas tetramitiformis]|uniref:Kinesin-like protein n=1 Tax=Cymbomonas tetramitiformis TaxID=36881 RepID=A0AAE0BI33_9CHLO|nr:hypothetical protein CYMTET_53018 [Cymbomonas tetramitiformis]